MTFLADGYRNVDAAVDLAKLKECLSLMEDLPDFQAYKRTSYDALTLDPESRVADVACGLGFDLPRLKQLVPKGTVTGFDLSETFLSHARGHAADALGEKATSVTFRQCDVQNIDCDAGLFDAARIDRSLQHIHDPDTAITEMTRIVRSGGIVCAAEPDWSTYVINSDLPEVSGKITRTFARTFRNPLIGRTLGELLGNHLTLTHQSTHPLVLQNFPDAETIFDISETVSRCVTTGDISEDEGTAFLNDLEQRNASGQFFALLTVHVAAGRKR
ncbi:methyltransferase domain-containing protein [Roseibium sp. SCP14]|uniref:methyltransferase domain-containing protein n=1 Tax=Roseibium sp. SCP14 TaxID=3141375 RepID=UPI003339880C